jgi:hypothetical protein
VVLIVSILIMAVELPPLWKHKQWLNLILAGVFISMGFFLTLLFHLGIEPPSQAAILNTAVERLFPFIPAFFGF